MAKLLTTANNYYWASMVMSLAVVFNLVQGDFVAVGVFLILSAMLIAIGFAISRASDKYTEKADRDD